MAAAAAADSEVDAALSALTVRFDEGRTADASWRLGCDARKAVDASSFWCAAHDEALLQALLALGALGGLPSGAQTGKSKAAWEAAQAALRGVAAGLAHVGPAPHQAPDAHACRPGYDVSACKLVRLMRPVAPHAHATRAPGGTHHARAPPERNTRTAPSRCDPAAFLHFSRPMPWRARRLGARCGEALSQRAQRARCRRRVVLVVLVAHHKLVAMPR
jgi:hypothetical protein